MEKLTKKRIGMLSLAFVTGMFCASLLGGSSNEVSSEPAAHANQNATNVEFDNLSAIDRHDVLNSDSALLIGVFN